MNKKNVNETEPADERPQEDRSDGIGTPEEALEAIRRAHLAEMERVTAEWERLNAAGEVGVDGEAASLSAPVPTQTPTEKDPKGGSLGDEPPSAATDHEASDPYAGLTPEEIAALEEAIRAFGSAALPESEVGPEELPTDAVLAVPTDADGELKAEATVPEAGTTASDEPLAYDVGSGSSEPEERSESVTGRRSGSGKKTAKAAGDASEKAGPSKKGRSKKTPSSQKGEAPRNVPAPAKRSGGEGRGDGEDAPYGDDVRALMEQAAMAPDSPIGNVDDIDFDRLPRFGFSLEKPDPSLPQTAPARLPDIDLVERAVTLAKEEKEFKRRVRDFQRRTNPDAKKTPLLMRLTELVRSALEEAADELVGRNAAEFALVPLNPVRLVVALSGGRDSMALLDVVARLFAQRGQALVSQVTGVYVNHGLSPNAKVWEEHCRRECELRGVRFEAVSVQVRVKGEGIESAAREARYRALVQFAKREGCDVILTGHHEDDRIETFLLQWMRGAGPEGLAAFPKTRELGRPGTSPSLVAREVVGEGRDAPILLVRPWCGVLRRDIDRYAKNYRLKWVEDESNADPRFSRNRIRNEVIPMLEAMRPGFRHAAARSVELIAETVDVLRSVAETDLAACRSEKDPKALNIFRLLSLIPARQAWCLRAWMTEAGMRAPSKARLTEALRQVRETHSDSAFAIRVGSKEIRRWGSDLVVREVPVRRTASERDTPLVWTGSDIPLSGWEGVLRVRRCEGDEPGIALARLASGALEVRSRRGGEKLKLWPLRPSKNLKDLYAEADVPAFERTDLPLLWLDGELVFAAGLGLEIRAADDPKLAPERYRFVFERDSMLLGGKAVPNFGELSDEERRRQAERLKAEAAERRKKDAAGARIKAQRKGRKA